MNKRVTDRYTIMGFFICIFAFALVVVALIGGGAAVELDYAVGLIAIWAGLSTLWFRSLNRNFQSTREDVTRQISQLDVTINKQIKNLRDDLIELRRMLVEHFDKNP